jgi:hypothetical protein
VPGDGRHYCLVQPGFSGTIVPIVHYTRQWWHFSSRGHNRLQPGNPVADVGQPQPAQFVTTLSAVMECPLRRFSAQD